MTQRQESVVDSWPGGIAELVRETKSRDFHLVWITDDQGVKPIAASVHSFDVLA